MAIMFSPYTPYNRTITDAQTDFGRPIEPNQLKVGQIITDIHNGLIGVVTQISDQQYVRAVDCENKGYAVLWDGIRSCHTSFVNGCMYVHRYLQVVYKVFEINGHLHLCTLGTISEFSGGQPLDNGATMIINSTTNISDYEPLLIVVDDDEQNSLPRWATLYCCNKTYSEKYNA